MFEDLEMMLSRINQGVSDLSAKLETLSVSNESKLTFDAKELAQALGYGNSSNRIDELRREGLIRGIKTGRKWVYPKAEVDRFLNAMLGQDLHDAAGRATAYVQQKKQIERR